MSTSADWKRLQDLIKNESELIKIMGELPEEEFHQLVEASREYAGALKVKYEALKEEQGRQRVIQEAAMQEKRYAHEEHMERQRMLAKQEEMREEARQRMELEKHRAEHAKKVAEHAAQTKLEMTRAKEHTRLQVQREFSELEGKRLAEEERLARVKHELEEQARQAAHQRETQLRLSLQRQKSEMKRLTELELAERKVEQDLRKHELMKDWILERDLDLKRVDAEAEVRKEELKWQAAQDFFAGREGRRRLLNGALFATLTIGGFFLARNVVSPFLVQAIRKRFFKPKLISRRVTYHPVSRSLRQQAWWPFKSQEPTVVLPPALSQRMQSIVQGTMLTSSRNGFFSHMMLYGKPGTGKTLFAEKLALESHMDFAVMSGPSFAQFEAGEAITEIKNLFQWANASSHGLLLFVDEADSFLEDRATMNPHRVAVLNEWINQTGTESKRFMCIYETNRPEVIDPAVQSRITRSIEIPTPGYDELLQQLTLYVDIYLHADGRKSRSWNPFKTLPRLSAPDLEDPDVLQRIAKKLSEAGFVGRDVTNLVIAWSQTAYASDGFALTLSEIDRVVSEQISKKEQEFSYLQTREGRLEHYRLHARVSMAS